MLSLPPDGGGRKKVGLAGSTHPTTSRSFETLMKFLAILEDSFREAIASYVCMVQIALTVVFVLLVASLSFYPMDARSAFQPLGPYFLETTHTDPNGAAQLARIARMERDPLAVLDAGSINGAETPQ